MMEQIDSWNASKAIYDTELDLMNGKRITLEELIALGTQEEKESTAYDEGISLTPSYYDPVTKKMFIQANEYLFSDKKNLIVYQWNNDWSNYFTAGKDGWAAAMWTVYDPKRNKFTVVSISIGPSGE